jgi:galactose oxidase-like protein
MPSPWVSRSAGRRWWGLALATALLPLGGPSATAQLVGPPELTGRWTPPFEEGGLETPRCVDGGDGRIVCKPVGQAMAPLPDGRVFYFNGLEGQENGLGLPADFASRLRDSTSRILDLRTGVPRWSVPAQPGGGGGNPATNKGPIPDPTGLAGIPGRPGDGLVGSAVGQVAPEGRPPTSPPDDPEANDGDMFCSDITLLGDGRLLVAGGSDWYNEPGVPQAGVPEAEGLRTSRLFDPRTDTFGQTAPMKYGRWHPALVTLPDGKVLAAGGATKRVKNTQLSHVRRTETFDPATDSWSENYTGLHSETSLPLSPRMHLMPNGKVLYAAAGEGWAPFGPAADEATFGLLQFYDPKTKAWEVLGPHPFGFHEGASSMLLPLKPPYEEATVLTFGGTLGPPPGSEVPPLVSAITTVDRKGKVLRQGTSRGPMKQPRWSPSGVSLADGTILAVAGATNRETVTPGMAVPVHTSELFDPRSEQWYEMSRSGRDRVYHHSAVLLPDARVLLGGHAPAGSPAKAANGAGGPQANHEPDPSFEIFSPHYLFRGPRPQISQVQAGIRWGETFRLTSPSRASIESVLLIRIPSPQHGIDSDTRTVILGFKRTAAGLKVAAPPDGAIAPPGYYYLFINSYNPRRGAIPSMARVVHVGDRSDLSEAPQPVPDDAPVASGSAAPADSSDVSQITGPVPGSILPRESLALASSHDPGTSPPTANGLPVSGVLAAGASVIFGRRWLRRRR